MKLVSGTKFDYVILFVVKNLEIGFENVNNVCD